MCVPAGCALAAWGAAQERRSLTPTESEGVVTFDDQSGELALTLSAAPVAGVLQTLAARYGLVVRCPEALQRRVTLDVRLPLADALRELLAGAPYALEVQGRELVLAPPRVDGKPLASPPDATKPPGSPSDTVLAAAAGALKSASDAGLAPATRSLAEVMDSANVRPAPAVAVAGGRHARLELRVSRSGRVRVGTMVEIEGPLVSNDHRSGPFVFVVETQEGEPVLGAGVDPFEVRPLRDGSVRESRPARIVTPDEVTVWLPLPERFLARDVLARTRIELLRVTRGESAPMRLDAAALPALRACCELVATVASPALTQVQIEKR